MNTKSFETIRDQDGKVLNGKAAYDYLNTYFTSVPTELSTNFDNDVWTPLDCATVRDGVSHLQPQNSQPDFLKMLLKY